MSDDINRAGLTAGSEEQIRLFLGGVKDYAIFMLDAGGKVVSWNNGAADLFGYAAAEAIGRHFALFFVPEDVRAGKPAEELREAEEKGQVACENWHVRKDGTRFWASEVTTALRDERGGPHGFAKVMRDTTDRKRLELELRRQAEELAAANRHKDEFLAMLSHELRNPLAPVLNAVHILRERPGDAAAVGLAGTMIERQVTHMARLIEDLLDASHLARGRVALKKERVELGGAVGRAAEGVRPLMQRRGHEFAVTPPARPVWVEADPTRLDQVFVNLLDNAAKYTDPGGRVEIATARDGGDAVVRVRDNGIGIAPALLPRVFDLFTQGDTSLDRRRGGVGVGLTLVKNVVGLHGGTVEALSAGEGAGAEFVVRLPALAEGGAAERPRDTGVPPPARALRMLVVDDNADTATSLAMLLELYGHTVETAHDGEAAVAAATGGGYDAILLDIGLPKLDGYDAARCIRSQAAGGKPLLVAVSGYGSDADREQSRAAGFDHHLVKPVDPREIGALLARFAAPPP